VLCEMFAQKSSFLAFMQKVPASGPTLIGLVGMPRCHTSGSLIFRSSMIQFAYKAVPA